MESIGFLIVAGFVVAFGLVSARFEDGPVTAPMVFVTAGTVMGMFGLFDVGVEDPVVETLMELTLAIVLFTDAARIELSELRREFRWPVRLLGAGLPLSIVLGTAAGLVLFPGWSFWEAVVLAVVLAPTDAALGQEVVTSDDVPMCIRQTLNVESGLNDGLALPVLTIALAFAGAAEAVESVPFWVRFAGLQLGVGIAAGALIGYGGGKLISWSNRRGWMTGDYQRLAGIAVALLAFGVAVVLDGSGFIAAFAAGVAIGNSSRETCTPLFQFAEAEGQLLTLLTFLLFGAIAVAPALNELTWQAAAYAVLSLLVVRTIAVGLSLIRSGMLPVTVGFIGWFGPRGVASVLFGLLVLAEAGLTRQNAIFSVVTTTVVLSVFAHGITAGPAARRYGRRIAARADMAELPEMAAAPDVPFRVRRTRSVGTRRPGAVP